VIAVVIVHSPFSSLDSPFPSSFKKENTTGSKRFLD
jgi:hypothetical protein